MLCALFLPWAVIKSRKLRANTTNYYDIHLLKEICYLGESLNRIIYVYDFRKNVLNRINIKFFHYNVYNNKLHREYLRLESQSIKY